MISHLSALHSFFRKVSPSLSKTALVFFASLFAAIICTEELLFVVSKELAGIMGCLILPFSIQGKFLVANCFRESEKLRMYWALSQMVLLLQELIVCQKQHFNFFSWPLF